MTFKGKKIIITGGLGFIGSNLAQTLVEAEAELILVDSLIPEYGGNLWNIENIKDKIQINISDVRDEHSMKYLVKGKDFLFNLAGQTSHIDSMNNPHTDLEINAHSQLYILEACRKYNKDIKIVFASTRQMYGVPQYLPVDEKHRLAPVAVNGINKMAGEYQIVPFPDDRKIIDIGDYYGDYRKIRSKLGWKPKISLDKGLELTIEFYKKYGQYYWGDE
ncbi:MAG: GDP-mannose 4,6-dehydratase [Desulfobacterales bacterium]|nr:GDP-mannose 4,6-dehydratase [Desulfobacterales bacterium]